MIGHHGYTWSQVRQVPARLLRPLDVLIRPQAGTAYQVDGNGMVRGWTLALTTMPLHGQAWRVLARTGDELTAQSGDGQTVSQLVPAETPVLRVPGPHTPARWAMHGPYGGRRYDWPQCRFCGRAQQGDCRPVECALCRTRQCHGNGLQCAICLHGWLPGWSRTHLPSTRCGYARCDEPAIATAPRVARVCRGHVGR
ncbi:MAG TPA: hypothetical protein VFM37_17835, partial [Pseudonocardiaceae bacterium]|nr:hypothetical protein [Pseudonocardiaceae bacterium]